MKKQLIEKHPLGFFLPKNTQILMLGSFPPKKERWSMDFYYPNFQNDMWRILGIIFFNNQNYFINTAKKGFNKTLIESFCYSKGIALGDTAIEIIRLKDNASDKFLQVIKPINIKLILSKIPKCYSIIITGQKAIETFVSVSDIKEPKIGSFSEFSINNNTIKIFRAPSSSRAYPMPLSKKAEIYKRIFKSALF
jgi:G:T/U-mismatch repair DNA glycosylase